MYISMLRANTGKARIDGKGHECPLHPPKATRIRGRNSGFYALLAYMVSYIA